MNLLMAAFYSYLVVMALYAIFSTAISLQSYKPEKVRKGYRPRALVMVPCKGIDLTLNQNLRSLKNQRYRNYDLVAIVDSEDDSAIPDIKKAGIRMLLSSDKFKEGSGKVNALATAINRYGSYDVYVVADSDILAGSDWLGSLIAPLANRKTGLSTTFPYFKPIDGFWSKVKMVWGLVGQGMMESKMLRFGWGGSMAFRKDLLDKKSFDFFKCSLSDDISITKIARRKGMELAYVKEAQPTVNCADTFATFTEWANRQTALSIRGNGNVFRLGVLSYGLSIMLFFSAVVLSLFYSYFALPLFIPIIAGLIKNHRRLKESHPVALLIQLIMPFIFISNLLRARSMASIEWRGKKYSLSGPPNSVPPASGKLSPGE